MNEYGIVELPDDRFLPIIMTGEDKEGFSRFKAIGDPKSHALCLDTIRLHKEAQEAKFLENNGLEEFMGYEIPKNSCGLTRHILTFLSQRGVAVYTHDDRSTPRKQLEDIADANGFTTFKEENRIVLIDENHWG